MFLFAVDPTLRLRWSWNAWSSLLHLAFGHQKPRRYMEPQVQPRTMARIPQQAVQGECYKQKRDKSEKSIVARCTKTFLVAVARSSLNNLCNHKVIEHRKSFYYFSSTRQSETTPTLNHPHQNSKRSKHLTSFRLRPSKTSLCEQKEWNS